MEAVNLLIWSSGDAEALWQEGRNAGIGDSRGKLRDVNLHVRGGKLFTMPAAERLGRRYELGARDDLTIRAAEMDALRSLVIDLRSRADGNMSGGLPAPGKFNDGKVIAGNKRRAIVPYMTACNGGASAGRLIGTTLAIGEGG